tara:strand:+ start:319 stop:654 length:336 start_codon:yes stop_codon:yes gene_type:complete
MEDKTFTILAVVIVVVIIVGFVVHGAIEYRNDKKSKENVKFPPFPNKCPDYWEVKGDGRCENVHKVGLCKAGGDNVMDFNDPLFEGKKGMYRKCSWSKQCEAPWEGIDSLC